MCRTSWLTCKNTSQPGKESDFRVSEYRYTLPEVKVNARICPLALGSKAGSEWANDPGDCQTRGADCGG